MEPKVKPWKIKTTSFATLFKYELRITELTQQEIALNPETTYIMHQLNLEFMICHSIFQQNLCYQKWNKLHGKPYKPFQQCKGSQLLQMSNNSKNVKICIAKTKVYAQLARVADTLPIIYIAEQNLWN